MLADRGQLPGEVGELPLMRDGPLGPQGVPGEHHAELRGVQAHRAVRVSRRVDDLERGVGDLEDAAVLHIDVGIILRMSVAPQQPVPTVQRHRRLVALGHVDRRGDVVGVAVRADDREHLTVAHRVEHGRGIATRIDDDDLVVVTDNPDVDLGRPRVAVGRRGRRHPINPCAHPGVSLLVSPHSPPFLPQRPDR